MEANTQESAILFRVFRNDMKRQLGVWSLILAFLVCSNGVAAQRIFNINSENAAQRVLQQSVQAVVSDSYFGVSEQARAFEYNPQLISLTKENEGDILTLDFFDDKRYIGKIQNVTRYKNGVTGITAKIDGSAFSNCYIAVSSAGITIMADVFEKNESYLITKKGATTYLCRYKTTALREKEFPCEGIVPPSLSAVVPGTKKGKALSETGTLFTKVEKGDETLPGALAGCALAALESEVTIDIMVLYTSEARQWANDNLVSIDNVIGIAMQKTNEAMTDSETGITIHLVHAEEVDYEDTNGETALYAITDPNDGIMDEVHALRKRYHADLVTLFSAYNDNTGGVGWTLDSEDGMPENAFSVCRVQQAVTGTSMVHEIGHNMGCAHDKQPRGLQGLYSYSHGWRGEFSDGTKFSTIMSYEDFNGTTYPAINYFSDPEMIIDGTPIGDSDDGNNVLTLRRTKRLTSLYSDAINTSLSGITLSAGTLAPTFDPDITNYVVDVANSVSAISISGTANYDCATITGEATNAPLGEGINIFVLTVISHDERVSKSYTIIVNREVSSCYSYESRPVFPGNITAPAGDSQLNLMMSPASPTTDYSGNNVSVSMPAASSQCYIMKNENSQDCFFLRNYIDSRASQIRVTKTGQYEITVLSPAIYSLYDAETPSCESFVSSSAYMSYVNGFHFADNFYVTLEAHKPYYIISIEPLDISILGDGVCYSASVIPNGTGYTYIAVDQADNTVSAQNATGDFRTLTNGVYIVYGVSYSTTGTPDPDVFVGETVSDLQNTGCLTLSATSVVLTVAGVNDAFGISIANFTGGSVSVSSYSSSNGSLVPIGETVTLTVLADIGYELETLKAYKTLDTQIEVTLDDAGGIYSFEMPDYSVTISATFDFNNDQQAVLNAKDAINASASLILAQENVSDEATLKTALVSALNALLVNEGINYTVNTNDITIVSIVNAVAGTATNISGTDGSFSFSVKLKIGGNTTEETTNTKSGVITATPYDNTQDNDDITTAKQTLEDASFTDTQANISSITSAKAKVLAIIDGLNLNDVTTAIIDETFTAAITGTVQNFWGTNGSYTFKVELTKGAGDLQTTAQLTLIIAATSYDITQDNNDIAAAKIAVEGATYTTTQADVQDQSQAKMKVESIIAGLNLSGATATVIDGMYIAAVEGTIGAAGGTDGSYSFTVNLNKGGGTEATTDERTLTITTTPYNTVQDDADIMAAKDIIEGANYVAQQLTVTDITKAKEAVEAIISTLSLNGVSINVIDDTFAPAITGTSSAPAGTNGSYQFTVELNKGGGAQQVTGPITLIITATPFTSADNYLVTVSLTANGTVTAAPNNPVSENETVTLTVAPAEGYDLDDIFAYNSNDGNETVALIANGNIRTFVMPPHDVTVTATFDKNTDQNDVEAAIQLINNMAIVSILQADANSEESVKTALVQQINDLTGMSATGITVVAADISLNGFIAAIEGTATNLLGANGSFAFSVTLKKTGSALLTSSTKLGVITATSYDATQDNDDIAAAKSAIESALYSDYQVNIQTPAQAKLKVEAIIADLTLNGVTTIVVDGAFTEAMEGMVYAPGGSDGSYKFTVRLKKGGGSEVTTNELTLLIYAKPYNPTQDNNDIAAAKALIEATSFISTQMNAPDMAHAKDAVEAIISTLSLNGVTANVLDDAFVAATTGVAGTPNGSNGSYTFIVELNKGQGGQVETDPLTLLITATPYTPPTTYLIHISLTAHGTVTADPTNPVDENANVVLTVTPAEGYELDMIKTYNSSDLVEITMLVEPDGSRTFPMPAFDVTVEATFKKTADQINVEDALQLINDMFNISLLQTTANTETDVITELVQLINDLPGMNATGITLTAADISVNGFTEAVEGTPTSLSGTNGSFTFVVTLQLTNSALMTSSLKTGVITATAYDSTQDNLDIATAQTVVEGAAYVDLQVNVQTQVQAKAKVETIIDGLNLNGVTAVIVDGLFTTAHEGTSTTPNGVDGCYTFTVKLNKGGGAEVVTNELTLTITATPYDATQDNDDITTAKALVEGATYITTQINAPDIAKAKEAVEAIISTLPLLNVTTNVIDGAFSPATAGTAGTPNGSDGSYDFTVELTKGAGVMETTISLTLIITATPHAPVGSFILNISPTTHGSVTATLPNPIDENDAVTLTIVPAVGYELDGIHANNVLDPSEMVLFTGTGNTRSFLMPPFDVTVVATFRKTAAQLEVEAAIALIDAMSNTSVLQETANDEATVKAWLALQINNLPGMSLTGIVVDVGDITIGGFNAATTGTVADPTGINGSFTFFVTLTQTGSATEKSAVKSGVIIAINYTAIKYAVTIEPTVNGTVTPNQTNVTAGTSILLSIAPTLGYELDIISVYKTGDAGTAVPLTAVGAARQFVMPTYDVTVYATFHKSANQLYVEAAKIAVENMNNPTVSMSTANSEATVKTWLAQQINALPTVSANGIIVTAANITFTNFTAAVGGSSNNAIGANGSFAFTVSLGKSGTTIVTTTSKTGVITATEFVAPLYSIYFNAMTNGIVKAVHDYAGEGETVTLEIVPDQGYQLESLTVTPSVTINGTGFIRTFVMPSNFVVCSATFMKTQEQLETEALEAIAAAIEGGSYRIAQGTGNTLATVKTWLVNTLNVMFDEKYNTQLRALEDPFIDDVTIAALTPAELGVASNPSGTNGAFTFTVNLQIGATKLATAATDGTIVAMPYATTPQKRVELLQLNDLTVRILNTGNVETGALNLSLANVTGDAFSLTETTTNSLSVGGETDIVLWFRTGLAIGVYKATLVVSGENLPATSLEITYTVTVTGNDDLQVTTLRVWKQNGLLHVSGLTAGETWSVYSISGILVHRSIATSEDARIVIPDSGVYIIISGANMVKVVL